jgi:hypothetical protein
MVDYLMLHCPFAREVWNMVFDFFGVWWVMPRGVADLLACWQGWFKRHRNVRFGSPSLIA